MVFYSPYAFFLLLAVPLIIILYLLKQKYRETSISSLYLWSLAVKDLEANAPWQKLKRNILMILQIAAVILISLALSRPFLPRFGLQPENVVIVLDTSLSMQAGDIKPTRFKAAVNEIGSLVSGLSPSSKITLITTGPEAAIWESPGKSKNEILGNLGNLEATNSSSDYENTVALVGSLVRDNPETLVYWFGDTEVEVPGIEIEFMDFSGDGKNYAVILLTQRENLVLSRIANYSDADAVLPVSLTVGGRVFDAKTVEVAAGETSDIYWDLGPEKTGIIECSIDAGDVLEPDNRAFYTGNTNRKNRILLCGENNIFIEKAFALLKNTEISHTDSTSFDGLSDYDLYVFNGFYPEALPETGSIMLLNPGINPLFEMEKTMELPVPLKSGHSLLESAGSISFGISKASGFKLPGWADIVLNSDQGPLIFSGIYENHRMIVVSFDLLDSDFVLKPAFPIFITNAFNWLVPIHIENERNITSGDSINLNPDPKSIEVNVVTPSGKTVKLAPPFPLKSFDETNELGVYTLEQKTKDSVIRHYFSVNAPTASESMLKTGKLAKDLSLPESRREIVDKNWGTDLQPLVLGLLLLIICVEWWFYTNDI